LKYEAELKSTNLALEEERERASELENAYNDLQQKFKEDLASWRESEHRYKELLDQTQDHAKQIEMAASALSKDSK
jgi:gas vesicle protein